MTLIYVYKNNLKRKLFKNIKINYDKFYKIFSKNLYIEHCAYYSIKIKGVISIIRNYRFIV
jgi:hypothetical protein